MEKFIYLLLFFYISTNGAIKVTNDLRTECFGSRLLYRLWKFAKLRGAFESNYRKRGRTSESGSAGQVRENEEVPKRLGCSRARPRKNERSSHGARTMAGTNDNRPDGSIVRQGLRDASAGKKRDRGKRARDP